MNNANNDRFKFRVWDCWSKEMIDNPIYTYNSSFRVGCNSNTRDLVLMQCTGLKDKNGNLIFEGDILKDPLFDTCPILWRVIDSEYSGQLLESIEEEPRQYYFYEHDFKPEDFEIIGNIYQNPELLNQKEEV